MKFVHIADLHLDTPLISLKNNRKLIKKRRVEHKQIFKDVIKYIRDNDISMLFIAGDLFEQKYIEKSTIDFIINTLSLIPDTKVFITPGNHDPYIKNSPYRNYKWPDNVIIFDGSMKKYSFKNIDIYGYGFDDYECERDYMSEFEPDNYDNINVLITHGNLIGKSRYNDLKEKELEIFDYVALGHIHKKKINNNIVYPGALFSCGFDECGEHGMVVGELQKGNVNYEFINMEKVHFEVIHVDISDAYDIDSIINRLDINDNIYKIILIGEKIWVDRSYICYEW